MDVNYELSWNARPEWIPGKVGDAVGQGNGGFLLLGIELNYPNGEKFARAYHPRFRNLDVRAGDQVLFTVKPAAKYEREKTNQPHKVEADVVRRVNNTDFVEAVNAFKESRVGSALEQLEAVRKQYELAKDDAQKAKDHAHNKEVEYSEKCVSFDKLFDQRVSNEVALEREKIDHERVTLGHEKQEMAQHREQVESREKEIAPYRKAIPLFRKKLLPTGDLLLPENLAEIWPDLLRTSGLDFCPDVATAFLLSIVTSAYSGSIVLLNGSVGVGKTSLVNQSAQALGGKCDVIPVRPAWIDPSDLLGFFDPINNTFRPTPFTTALRNTEEDRLQLICLDELNLAKIENYAADLLSCIEYSKSNSDAGMIKLYSTGIEQELWEEAKDISEQGDEASKVEQRRLKTINTLIQQYPSQFEFPKNAVLIGTLNSDETTYDLSPKMIDRSYVITFPPTAFEPPTKKREHPKQQVAVAELFRRIDEAKNIPAEYWEVVLDWNKKLQGDDKLQGFGIPLGHRVKRDYDNFRATGSVMGLSEQDCLGYFLFCKILPRIFFFKEQNNADTPSESRCKLWLIELRENYGTFGPIYVIDMMIKMCEDERIPTVRYWSKS